MPKYFHLAYQSFWGKILSYYFNTSNIINAFVIALILWLPLCFEYLSFSFWPLHVSLFFAGFAFLLYQNRVGFFWTGAFVGLFWFYWISFSLIHYGFWYLIPLALIAIMLIYGFLFYLCAIFENIYYKTLALFGLGFVAPFGFNWFDWRLFLIDTPFRVDMLGVFVCFVSIALFVSLKNRWRWASIFILIFALEFHYKKAHFLPNVQIIQTNVAQSKKWEPQFLQPQIDAVFHSIETAILENKSLIIFPESALPLYLNHNDTLRQKLLDYSSKIAIILGALTYTDDGIYNSSYFYSNQKEQIAHKVVLVPFGEQVPLPKFLRDWINEVFYKGAKDFLTAPKPQDFKIKNLEVRSAICFEATRKELFRDFPKIMVAISNNAWFTPSIQPYLQRRLLRVYATKYETTIYHSTNGSKAGIITPYNGVLANYFNKAWNSSM